MGVVIIVFRRPDFCKCGSSSEYEVNIRVILYLDSQEWTRTLARDYIVGYYFMQRPVKEIHDKS